jgi:predicted molibdopterin-dependent oxidoreductase YjgC
MFALLPESPAETVNVILNGESVPVPRGFSAAAAVLLRASGGTRTTPVSGAPRAPYCMMGVCFECLLEIDGEPNRQGCLVTVAEGMRIRRQLGKAALGT